MVDVAKDPGFKGSLHCSRVDLDVQSQPLLTSEVAAYTPGKLSYMVAICAAGWCDSHFDVSLQGIKMKGQCTC